MERFIIAGLMLLSCFGSVMAQGAAQAEKSEVKAEVKSESKAEVKSDAKSGCMMIQNVYVVLDKSDEKSANYVKWFNTGIPLDSGTGVRQEKSSVFGSSKATKNSIVISFVAAANGESQLRKKSWFGMRDQAVVVVRDGVVVYIADFVKGIPTLSEVTEKCF
jgi:hypothetical protein